MSVPNEFASLTRIYEGVIDVQKMIIAPCVDQGRSQ